MVLGIKNPQIFDLFSYKKAREEVVRTMLEAMFEDRPGKDADDHRSEVTGDLRRKC